MSLTPKQLAGFLVVISGNPTFRNWGDDVHGGVFSDLKELSRGYLSMTDTWTKEQWESFDADLRKQDLPSVSAVIAWLKKGHAKILKRGKIRNDEEYYFVRGLLADVDFPLSAPDRENLSQIERAYEARARGFAA